MRTFELASIRLSAPGKTYDEDLRKIMEMETEYCDTNKSRY